jgi:hypothetical protein
MIRSLRIAAAAALIMVALPSLARAEMTFRVVSPPDPTSCRGPCAGVIQAEGRITANTPRQFVEFTRAQIASGVRLRNIVLIHSPGGAVQGALELGTIFRRIGATVVVARSHENSGFLGFLFPQRDGRSGEVIASGSITNAVCNSACVYAVMGGKNRVIPQQSIVGVHRMQAVVPVGFDPSQGGLVTQRLSGTPHQVAVLKRYARDMGADARLIALAESIPHETIRRLTPEEVRKFRLARTKL